MKLIGPLIALALVAFAPAQKPTITLNVKDGEVITGEKLFVIKVQAKNPITQVEFYVGSELRDSDASTPYQFKLDTLGETDGTIKVKFSAYTSEGENTSKTLTLKVDNGISKGAAFHLERAKDMLAISKWDDAITSARIALKADSKSVPARIYLARAYMGKGVWDKAQKFAEDAGAADPNSYEAMELTAAINLNRAFSTINRSGDRNETIATISTALKNAVTARRKSLDRQIDNFGAVNDGNRMAYVDLALKGARYSIAVEQLVPVFKADAKNNDAANRLIFAYMRAGRLAEAREALDNVKKYGVMDAYGNALEAVWDSLAGKDALADDAMREAILSDPDNLGVKSAQAFIALRRSKSQVLGQIAKDLLTTDSQRTEVNYFLSALYNRLMLPDSEKFYRRAILIEPTNYDMYIEWGNYSLGLGVNKRVEQKDRDPEVNYAQVLYNAALTANPSSAQALTGLSLVSLYQNKIDDAVRYGKAAALAAPQYAAGHYAYAAAASAKASSIKVVGAGANEAAQRALASQMTKTAYSENQLAGTLDPIALKGRELPKVNQAWLYFQGGGRTVVMVPPGR